MIKQDIYITKAIQILKDGGIVIFPTDTAFGIGCGLDKHDSIKRLFKIRKRPQNQAMPVLVNSIEMANKYFIKSPLVENIMQKYWPGAVTVIGLCNVDLIDSLVRGGGNTIGFRMPNHPDILNLISTLNVPIIGTSANFHGETTPYKFSDLNADLKRLVDFIVPGECIIGKVSTVVDCSSHNIHIVRQGAVQITI
jgi:L-threonylcarbamoyladenylate synthase